MSRGEITFAQTDLKSHEKWGEFSARCPRASSVLHYLVARAGRYGSIAVSHSVLAEICGVSVPTLKRALTKLRDENWIQVIRVGSERGGVNCYLIDQGVCWSDTRSKMGWVELETRVIAAAREQPTGELEHTGKLKQVPAINPGEVPLPQGPGEDPPSQPSLDGMEPVLYRDEHGREYEVDRATGELQQRIGGVDE